MGEGVFLQFALWRLFFTGSPRGRIAVQNQPDTCFALFKEKRMKFKNGIAIAKNFSPVQTNFKNEITQKLLTLFKKKRKCSNRWSTKLVREGSRGKAKEF